MVYIPYLNESLNAVIGITKRLLSSTSSKPKQNEPNVQVAAPFVANRMLVRIAGLSGALAVLAGAYGAHGFKDDQEKDKRVFQTGAYYHLIHSVALVGTPLASRPYLSATLFIAGMTMFCGSCYYVALTKDERFSKVAPVGGVTLVAAWVSLVL